MTTPIRTCSRCGCTSENLIEFRDRLLCPDCLDSMTEICVDCSTRFWHRDNCNTAASPLCPDCCDRNYTRCTRCGSLISLDNCWYPYDNDDPYCSDCCSDIENSPIHDYYFKPRPIFYGTRPRFFGVELEIDGAGEDSENASTLLNIANRKHSFAYCKHDDSLDDGFEIVTHPMSLEYQLHEMPWDEVLHEAIICASFSTSFLGKSSATVSPAMPARIWSPAHFGQLSVNEATPLI